MARIPTLTVSAAAIVAIVSAATLAQADAPSSADVRRAFTRGDRDAVTAVFAQLRGHLDRSAIRTVLSNAPRFRELGVYDELVATLRTAQDDALDELIRNFRRERRAEVRFLILDALGPNTDASAEETLASALESDRDEPVQVLAARLLGRRGTAGAVEALIAQLASLEKDPSKSRLVREVNAALGQLTGQEITVAQDWQNYWAAHKDNFTGTPAAVGQAGGTKTRNVMDRMNEERPADARTITRMRDDDIIVIRGQDRCEEVLRALDMKHQVHERSALEGLTLDPERQTVILNCPGTADMSDAAIDKIRVFVAQGGYLFCSDWELQKTLAKAFPEAVVFHGETSRGEHRDVTIQPVPQSISHPLMRDVFPLNSWVERGMTWNLHQRSHLPKASPALTPLILCPELEKYGSTTVAFTFGFTTERGGRPVTGAARHRLRNPGGQVLWVSSHFRDQKDEKGDGFALQQLMLNFILEKQEDRRQQASRR